MCTCASCEHTDSFSGFAWDDAAEKLLPVDRAGKGGFASWPRGNPTGPKKSAAEYAAHVAHLWQGVARGVPFMPGQAAQFPAWTRGNGPIAQAPKYVLDWINRKTPSTAETVPASPAQPAKAAQHLPAADRSSEPGARIYAMPKSKRKDEKRPRGRPAIEGRRVVIKLEERQIRAAEKLGDGNIAEGIRRAIGRRS